MATGIPKVRSYSNKNEATDSANPRLSLQYDGQSSREEILTGRRDSCESVWEAQHYGSSNRLYFGDNLPILRALMDDVGIRGTVRLIYIDPPFASNNVFQSRSFTDAYDDLLDGVTYIDFMRKRLIVMKELLANDGSIYVHLDGRMVFHIKVLMDDLFGLSNFRNLITRQKCNPKNYTRNSFGNVSDYILFYTKSDRYVWNRAMLPWDDERKRKEYPYVESHTGRRYKRVPIHAPGIRNGDTGKPWKGINPPPGKHWQYRRETLDRFDMEGQIYWSANGNPRRKVYADQSHGIPVQDIWLDVKDPFNQNSRITGYPTEKNIDLLTRIINASSDRGDLVLDCFAGSGTTLEAANRLGRSWIGIDNSIEAIDTIVRRLRFGSHKMGDYVKDRPLIPNDTEDASTIPLFDWKQDIQPQMPGGLKYENSQDSKPEFRFLVSRSCRDEFNHHMFGVDC